MYGGRTDYCLVKNTGKKRNRHSRTLCTSNNKYSERVIVFELPRYIWSTRPVVFLSKKMERYKLHPSASRVNLLLRRGSWGSRKRKTKRKTKMAEIRFSSQNIFLWERISMIFDQRKKKKRLSIFQPIFRFNRDLD